MAKPFEKIKIALKTRDVRKKILITAACLIVFRLFASIPVPGIPRNVLEPLFGGTGGGFLNFVDIFTGGTLRNFSIMSIGLGAYINASVIFQMLGMVVKKIELLQKEGEAGRRKINQWTRMLTVVLSALQSFGIYTVLKSPMYGGIESMPALQIAVMVTVMTAGAIFLMWLGEVISEDGVGNGISLLIMAGIVSGLPSSISRGFFAGGSGAASAAIVIGLIVVIVVILVMLNEATRKIEVQYAKRIRGGKMLGGASSYLPMKILQAGVMPIIFASMVLSLPLQLAYFISSSSVKSQAIMKTAQWLITNLSTETVTYAVVNFLFVVFFSYFYAFIVFKPDDVAENLKKQGGFIPGIRPGEQTAEYLTIVMSRLLFVGSLVLAIMSTMPFVLQKYTQYAAILSSGTSILIVVSVILETKRAIDAMLVTRSYEGFLQ